MFPIITYGMEKIMQMKDMEDGGRYFEVDTVVNFGKNKGLTIQEIFERDPDYLIWMYENFDNTDWSEDVEILITRAYDGDYFESHEYTGDYSRLRYEEDLRDEQGIDNPDDLFF